jgi:hypothetical protein
MIVPIYMVLFRFERKGLFFIQAITLCRFHEIMRRMAVEERYHPQAGGSKKVKKPFGVARRSLQNV